MGCNVQEKKDVYSRLELGIPLTVDILKDSEQIVKNESELIIVYNISDQWDYYAPHLLFFNDSLKLYAACYFPSERIESLNNNIITGYLNTMRNQRISEYRNDLPEKYRLSLIKKRNSHGRKSDKLIEKIKIDSTGTSGILHVLQSKIAYVGLRGKKLFENSNFLENYTSTDILRIPISKLSFRYEENTVSINEITSNDRLIWDYMLVPEMMIIDDFYKELFTLLSK